MLLLRKLSCKAELYAVWINYPNLNREIPAIQGARLKESITLKCIDTYFDEHGTEFISTLQKIYSIYSYYEQCSEAQWKAYEDNGIVPYCFWRNAGTAESSYYYLTDRPYTSGVIDGAYGQVKGLYDIHKNFEKLIDAYGVGLLECDNLLDDYQSYERLQERIKQLEKEDGFWAAIKNSVNRYVARNKADKILACLTSEKVRDDSEETITKLYDVVSNSEKLATASASIAKRLEAYLKQITKTDELARYKQGKLVADLATLFIGTGEANSARKIITFEEYLGKSASNVEKAGAELIEREKKIEGLADNVVAEGVDVGKYTTKIRWGILDVEVRPFGKGFLGKRIIQSDARVNAFELKINPNNESFYLPHPDGGYVQFENVINSTVQDGKLIMDKSSIYYVLDKPEFLNKSSVLDPALRQLKAANASGYKVEWLVSDEKAVQQITQYFKNNNVTILVKIFKE